MPLPPAPPLIRPPARGQWVCVGLAVLLLPMVVLGTIALGVASYFHLSSDTRALRNGILKASGVEWRRQLDLNLGQATLGIVRAGLAFAPLDTEAQAAVQAVRGVEVGIYDRGSGTKPPDRAAMFAKADTVLQARGWERLIGVRDGENWVSVYLPITTLSSRKVKCCVVAFDERQLVMVSGRINVEPLVECLRNQPKLRTKLRALAAR